MKIGWLSIIAAGLLAGTVRAQSPEVLAAEYFELLQAKQWDQIAGLYHPEALSGFKETMSFLVELPEEVAPQVLGQFFGPGTTIESIQAMTDAEFFAGFLEGMMGQASQLGPLNFKSVDVVGAVQEGEDLQHVVARTRIEVGEMAMEAMEVISYRRADAGWMLLMQGKMKGMAEQMRRAFEQQRP